MSESDERLDRIERRLDAVGSEVGQLRNEVGELRGEVHTLRVVVEDHDTQIRQIAEVQAHHGRKLDEHGQLLREIKEELWPLRDLRDFVARVASNHEDRLTALEQHTGIQHSG